MDWYPRYVPVGTRRARAAREMRRLRASGVEVQPVELRGPTIARSFWGQRWCAHLESFSDYANRLPRGRTYVRNGAVCHLAIDPGEVDAMVVGRDLYHVAVRVRSLKRPAWKAIKAACAGQIGSVLELLQGRLSDHVMEVVTDRDTGLFPKPREIKITCDCPDWATMCKHAAAVLYGVGSRLDESPELLFRLRGVDEAELIAADLTLPRGAATADTLADGDLGDIFGIDLDPEGDAPAPRRTPPPDPGARTPRDRPAEAGPASAEVPAGPHAAGPSEPAAGAGTAGSAYRPAASPYRFTGAGIAELRTWCGFSVAEFARLLRVSEATVRRWEATPGRLVLRGRTWGALNAFRREAGDPEA